MKALFYFDCKTWAILKTSRQTFSRVRPIISCPTWNIVPCCDRFWSSYEKTHLWKNNYIKQFHVMIKVTRNTWHWDQTKSITIKCKIFWDWCCVLCWHVHFWSLSVCIFWIKKRDSWFYIVKTQLPKSRNVLYKIYNLNM